MTYVTWVFETYFGYARRQGREADDGRARQGPRRRVQRSARVDGARRRGPPGLRALGDLREGRADGARLPARATTATSVSSSRRSACVLRDSCSQTRPCSPRRSSRPVTRSTTSSPRWACPWRPPTRRLLVRTTLSQKRTRRRSPSVTPPWTGCCRPRTVATTRSRPSSAGSPRRGCASARAATSTSRSTCCRRPSGDRVVLDESQAPAFLMALTDVRLLLGERMGMRTEEDAEALHAAMEDIDDDDPLGYAMAWYDFLTWLQETLTQRAHGHRPPRRRDGIRRRGRRRARGPRRDEGDRRRRPV